MPTDDVSAAHHPFQNPATPAIGDGPELYFGLVGPAGTDLNAVVEALSGSLRARNYRVRTISLSDLLREQDSELSRVWDYFEEERIRAAMTAGNQLCEKLGSNDAVMRLGLLKVRHLRKEEVGEQKKPVPRTAFIFKSLKRPEEYDLLREIYGDSFFLISVYEPKHQRVTNLAQKIAKTHQAAMNYDHRKKAELLIEDDEDEEETPFGQRVGDLFHKSDFFVEQNDRLVFNIERFIKLLFGSPYITPSRDEYGIFMAHAIALRSADLSRQVGAVIVTPDGELISEGCNEVPLHGGGSIWPDDVGQMTFDNRDFRIGYDSSSISKYEIFSEIFEVLKELDWLSTEIKETPIEEVKNHAFHSYSKSPDKYKKGFLKGSKLSRILEYGRVVHAEMHAICSAARLGRSLKGAVLYSTTFPCHMCARHILASGISRVVYIEPYPKSMTGELYTPMVQIDGDPCAIANALRFDPFNGVAPKQYFKRFSMNKRKDNRGYAFSENYLENLPKINTFIVDYETENFKVQKLCEILEGSDFSEEEDNEKSK